MLRRYEPSQIAVVASGRMTNEELWLTRSLVGVLGTANADILPHTGEGDDILLNTNRNPNEAGARLVGLLTGTPGAKLASIRDAVRRREVQAMLVLGEDLTQAGFEPADLAALSTLIVVDLLPNATTAAAGIVLPGASFAEKRGSMVNAKGRLQRLNHAIASPGEVREDWETLRDLIQQLSGSNGIYLIEDVFRQLAENIPAFAGLTLSRIGDLGVPITDTPRLQAVPEHQPA
jgi:NADH-quinone oxidoreductase subunit G